MATEKDVINIVSAKNTKLNKENMNSPKERNTGLCFQRKHTAKDKSPYDQIQWEFRTAEIKNDIGESVFRQEHVEVPTSWSATALNIVASKYFYGGLEDPRREKSVRTLVDRVVNTITGWGYKQGYFRSKDDADIFRDELAHLMVTQKASFNSPVWFNCGVEEHPQCSACFINSVEDTMESILDLAKTEGMLFKYGSGTGSNLSSLRSSKERLSTGGIASGPVSFMKGFDAFAGVIKSGGKTRRAAKMVILNIDHPDIEEFILCKAEEEKKAHALIDAGYDSSFNGVAYSSIFFQNANHSVRVTDDFMKAVEGDGVWHTRAVTTGDKVDKYKARELLATIAEKAWACGDPGIQFDTTINRWHTCKNTDRIKASNPCSEYMFLDDTACNLASLNLMKYATEDGEFDVDSFRHAVDVLITAQEIIVDNASYPRPKIGENSHLYRPLGLGYANLGALLMLNSLPYDSDEGRNYAAAITAIMSGQAYSTSARLSAEIGPFAKYEENREPMLDVIRQHHKAVESIDASQVPNNLYTSAQLVWKQAEELGDEHGFRNAQVTVLAPTGTIGLMMDCDTTGIEPDLALVKYKNLAGGGIIKMVNNTVEPALKKLDYTPEQIESIIKYIDEFGTIEGAPDLAEGHLSVFDCAFAPANGVRSIHYMGHVKMMAAVQPFLSGAISKTVNMPNDVTPEEIGKCYLDAWRLGVKAIAVYRDGCKLIQPMNAGKKKLKAVEVQPEPETPEAITPSSLRKRLPEERAAITHKFTVGGHEGYITVGLYDNGEPGEIFLVMAKEGSTVSGLMDAVATSISLNLQYGVPLEVLIKKFTHTRFEPSGWTKNKNIPHAKSVMDYIFRWLATKFLPVEKQLELGIIIRDEDANLSLLTTTPTEPGTAGEGVEIAKPKRLMAEIKSQEDAPSCPDCGLIMVRNGACYKCMNCGTTSGCS